MFHALIKVFNNKKHEMRAKCGFIVIERSLLLKSFVLKSQLFKDDDDDVFKAMFDRSARGQLQFEEFCALWQYVSDWDVCFKSFDIDYSGSINRNELKMALHHFGYRLTDPIVDLIIQKFDRYGRQDIMFDDFIQCCIILYVSFHVSKAFFRFISFKDVCCKSTEN